jgi:hypothetical protein
LELVVSHNVDWKLTAVFGPFGALATEVTPGGLKKGDAESPSIHCATGSKWAVLGNVPLTATLIDPIPVAGAREEVEDALVPVDAVPMLEVPVNVLIPRPAGTL